MSEIVKMRDVRFDPNLFVNYRSGTVLDNLLCSYQGLPKGVNYMVIGDPGVGKTTIILDLIANIERQAPGTRILFISAEMNEIDLAVYVQRYPKFGNLNIIFVESDFDGNRHHLKEIEDVLRRGWDIVAIDSFYELQGIVKEEEDITMRLAETKLLSLIKRHNKAENDTRTNTTFLTIQQVTKSGAFIGSNRLNYCYDGTTARQSQEHLQRPLCGLLETPPRRCRRKTLLQPQLNRRCLVRRAALPPGTATAQPAKQRLDAAPRLRHPIRQFV